MKNILLTIIIFFVFAPYSKGNVIDHRQTPALSTCLRATASIITENSAINICTYAVYYNDKILKRFANNTKITIQAGSIKKNDEITVIYSRDCLDGKYNRAGLVIKDENDHVIIVSNGKGSINTDPVSFTLDDLVALRKKVGMKTFNVFYSDEKQTEKSLIFTLILK